MTLALAVLALFALAPLPLLAARYSRRLAAFAAALPFVLGLFLVLRHAPEVSSGIVPRVSIPWVPTLGLDLALRLDGLALLFALLVLGIGLLIVLYAAYYLPRDDGLGRFYTFLQLFAGAMCGLVLVDNLLLMVVFWELTSISSFLLIGYWSDLPHARTAAQTALGVTAAGGLCLLAGVLLLGSIVGSFELDVLLAAGTEVRGHALFKPALVLVLLGTFSKSAQLPLHFWLPGAMSAPTPVSAYLHSATMVKAGIFVLARLHPALAHNDLWIALVGTVGLVTMLVGAYLALLQHDLKGLLAYSTISHLGLIVLLLGISTESAAIAAMFHVLNHATFKASLFMAAGIIDHETGTRDIRKLNGLFRSMPHTGTLAIIAAAAMAGVPLLNGFLSKEMLFAESLSAELPWVGSWGVPLAAGLAGVFGVAYSLRFVLDVFFRGDGGGLPKQPHEPPTWMRLPVELLALLCLLVGIFPATVAQPLVTLAAQDVVAGPLPPYSIALWHGFNVPLAMTAVAMALGGLLYLGLPRLHAWHHGHPEGLGLADSYQQTIEALVGAARALTASFESGSLQRYMAYLVAASLAAALVPYAYEPAWPALATSAVDLPTAAMWLLAVAATIAVAVLHQRRLVALILLSVIGSLVALGFVRLSAPDLALTQLLIEIVSIIVMLLALHHLPERVSDPAPRPRALALLIAGASGLAMAALTSALLSRPVESISDFFLAQSLPLGGGRNVVNVILVDFRAFDTMGEISVLGIAGLGVAVLLDGLTPHEMAVDTPRARDHAPVILQAVSRALLPLAIVMSVFLFLRGHNLPGGGFIGALLLAIALLLQYLASGSEWVHQRMRRDFRPMLGAGLAIAVATGLASSVLGEPAFTMAFTHVDVPLLGEIELASAMVFDLGVYLAVVGATLVALTRLAELSRSDPAADRAFREESDPWLP